MKWSGKPCPPVRGERCIRADLDTRLPRPQSSNAGHPADLRPELRYVETTVCFVYDKLPSFPSEPGRLEAGAWLPGVQQDPDATPSWSAGSSSLH